MMASQQRFAFGANWRRFLHTVGEPQVRDAETSLCEGLGMPRLDARSFLDIGSGSGLFSLAARRLGATVRSFDFDPQSVACTRELKQRFLPDDPGWNIVQGSILDREYIDRLGKFDVVYSWGVLHHTGNMSEALANAASLVGSGGHLFIAIYNDQGWISRYWALVKRLYNRNRFLRVIITALHFPYLFLGRFVARLLTGRLTLERGMSLWYDMHDWLGGYPFEVATPAEIEAFHVERGFRRIRATTCGRRSGCNEFVFIKN